MSFSSSKDLIFGGLILVDKGNITAFFIDDAASCQTLHQTENLLFCLPKCHAYTYIYIYATLIVATHTRLNNILKRFSLPQNHCSPELPEGQHLPLESTEHSWRGPTWCRSGLASWHRPSWDRANTWAEHQVHRSCTASCLLAPSGSHNMPVFPFTEKGKKTKETTWISVTF